MSNSDDEEDYLSPKFLQSAEESSTKPGRKRDYASIRRDAQRKSDDAQRLNNQRTMSRRQLERSAREEGLSKNLISEARISSSSNESGNKALDMMRKMGYKPGQALGQPQQSSSSDQKRATPLDIHMREGRGGLGTEPVRPPPKRQKVHVGHDGDVEAAVTEDKFKTHARSEADARKHVGQLRSAQRTLRELDAREGGHDVDVEGGGGSVLWIDPEEWEAEERRKVHAIRMGEREVDVEDVLAGGQQLEVEVRDEEREAWCALSVEDRLAKVLAYLREHHKCVLTSVERIMAHGFGDHRYCLYCGAQYASQQELDELCPGTQEDDH